MLPRLHAEEQLCAIQAAAIGGGQLSKNDTVTALNRLERRATGVRKRAQANPAVLAAMGIAVVEAPAEGEQADG